MAYSYDSATNGTVLTVSGGGGGGRSLGVVTTGSSGMVATPPPGLFAMTPPPAKAAGLRSIRIDIPRTGNAFLFTKVLNVRDEPLSVSASIMSLHTFQQRQMMAQVAAFLTGLVVWVWQWRGTRNSFVLTLALALMFGSVASLLIAWRALHDLLIIGFPIVLLTVVSWLIWKFWARRAKHSAESEVSRDPDEPGTTEIPPAVAGLVIAFVLAMPLTTQASEAPAVPAHVSVLSANYTGTVNERVAQLEAVVRVNAAQANQKIALFGEDVAVQSFSAKPKGGADLVVKMKQEGDSEETVFEGQLTGFFPSFDTHLPVTVHIRGMNKMHKFTRERRTRTFVNQTEQQIVSKIIQDNGLTPDFGREPPTLFHEHLHQPNMTDLEFLRLRAARTCRECYVEKNTFYFRKRQKDDGPVVEVSGRRVTFGDRRAVQSVIRDITERRRSERSQVYRPTRSSSLIL